MNTNAVRIPIRRPGAMNTIAQEMGYECVTDIPNSLLPEFVDLLIDKYGESSASSMITAQRVFRRKSKKEDILKAKRKFDLMAKHIRRHYQ